jgi:putative peptide zinc metalloprotease protein
VAVGFQVVLIVGQADVIVPENLSAAANYNCLDCLTYALASQLVLTMDGPLSEDGMARLKALWAEIAAFGRNIQNVPLSEIQAKLADYKNQITAVIQADQAASTSGRTAPTATATADPTQSSLPPSPGATAIEPGPARTGGVTSPATEQATQPAFGDPSPSSVPTGTAPVPATTTTSPAATAPATDPQPSPTTN